jgi:hypothetical protein
MRRRTTSPGLFGAGRSALGPLPHSNAAPRTSRRAPRKPAPLSPPRQRPAGIAQMREPQS